MMVCAGSPEFLVYSRWCVKQMPSRVRIQFLTQQDRSSSHPRTKDRQRSSINTRKAATRPSKCCALKDSVPTFCRHLVHFLQTTGFCSEDNEETTREARSTSLSRLPNDIKPFWDSPRSQTGRTAALEAACNLERPYVSLTSFTALLV